ncbi:MAG: polysaccharide deacetylase family protein [Waterburya sp.]
MKKQKKVIHGLSVDVEDWFHIIDHKYGFQIYEWKDLESRLMLNISHLLRILNAYNTRATFFVLGWVAERFPDLIRQIAEQGHEIGSHGYSHQKISDLTRDSFSTDLDRSLNAISKAANKDVLCYRAPGFSITNKEIWAFKVLASHGIKIDSSLFLGYHRHGGFKISKSRPFHILIGEESKILEFPIVPYTFMGCQIPFAGGGYLRLFPKEIVKVFFMLSELNQKSVFTYIHPRELDTNQPQLSLPYIKRRMYYVGINDFEKKLNNLLENFSFSPFGSMTEDISLDEPMRI